MLSHALLTQPCFAAQAGVWDVDGTGMWAIEDPEVDLGIRKVHTLFVFHSSTACSAVGPLDALPAQPCCVGCVLCVQSLEPSELLMACSPLLSGVCTSAFVHLHQQAVYFQAVLFMLVR